MPRKPRFYLPNIPAHIVQRGNNRQAVFYCDDDYTAYLDWLGEGALKYGCKIHAYVLMTNHIHLLLTPGTKESISRVIQYVGRKYVTYINHVYKRTGTLWEGRHKGNLIGSKRYLLACYRYIELNPVRAGMVAAPDEYRWSSYRYNAKDHHDPLITPHDAYLSLGSNTDTRNQEYRKLFDSSLNSQHVDTIRAGAQTGTPIGSDRFREQVENMINRKTGKMSRGRPVET